ncbi:MAG TPA: acyl-CoA carboxylase subunit epsilon [Intrasporangiaceae bacterium]|nr:acyl-CoA carboxylase subunit epsilon [Intrasporangiaceae bacterium]
MSTESTDAQSKTTTPDRPPLRVISGSATAEEIAAIVAVLAAASAGGDQSSTGWTGRSRWSAPASRLRAPLLHGPGAWRASARS